MPRRPSSRHQPEAQDPNRERRRVSVPVPPRAPPRTATAGGDTSATATRRPVPSDGGERGTPSATNMA